MLDRASTFADRDIVALLQTRFIPVAIDQAYQRRQQDTEGEFYRKIAAQGPRDDFQGTTQGFYAATAAGKLLFYNNNRGPDRLKKLLQTALDEYDASDAEPLAEKKVDPRYNPQPPEGGLVIRVRAKVLDGYDQPSSRWEAIFQSSVSRDNLWISSSEHASLVRGELKRSLAIRLARFHLVDNTRGEPPMWREQEVRRAELKLKGETITGSIRLATDSGDRGFEADVRGVVHSKAGRVTRFDLVAKGQFWGEGAYTRGAPRGKFPLLVSFELADGDDPADAIPPQGSRGWMEGYLGK